MAELSEAEPKESLEGSLETISTWESEPLEAKVIVRSCLEEKQRNRNLAALLQRTSANLIVALPARRLALPQRIPQTPE